MSAKKVATGGTFAVIHKGHKRLFFESAKKGLPVTVGVTVNPLVAKNHSVPSFEQRYSMIKEFFIHSFGMEPNLVGLTDHYGPVVNDPDYGFLVTSEENLPYACEINKIRIARGFEAVQIILVETERAFDRRPVSTTRIMNGEINEEGVSTCRVRRNYNW
jgi:phosphopantetheine adenylyltransferase